MFKRKIYDQLIEWKKTSSRECALLIDGARRVGKSYIVEEFAKAEYRSYAIIDFTNATKSIKDLFLKYISDLDTFFAYLSSLTNVKFYEHDTLIGRVTGTVPKYARTILLDAELVMRYAL